MTIVTKAVEDVAGNPDFTVWRFGSDLSLASDDVTIKSSRVVSVIPDSVDGKAVVWVDLDPGTVGVEYRGITTIIEVPDSDEPQDLLELLDAGSFLAGGEGFTPSLALRGSPVDDVTDDGEGGAEFWVLGESVGSVPMPGAVWSNLAGKPEFPVYVRAVGVSATDLTTIATAFTQVDEVSANGTFEVPITGMPIPAGKKLIVENGSKVKFSNGVLDPGTLGWSVVVDLAAGSSFTGEVDGNRAGQSDTAFNAAGGSAAIYAVGILAEGTEVTTLTDINVDATITGTADYPLRFDWVNDSHIKVRASDCGGAVQFNNCDNIEVDIEVDASDNDGWLVYQHAVDFFDCTNIRGRIIITGQTSLGSGRSTWFSGLTMSNCGFVNFHDVDVQCADSDLSAQIRGLGVSLLGLHDANFGRLRSAGYSDQLVEMGGVVDSTFHGLDLDGYYATATPDNGTGGGIIMKDNAYLPSSNSRVWVYTRNVTFVGGTIRRCLDAGIVSSKAEDTRWYGVEVIGCRTGFYSVISTSDVGEGVGEVSGTAGGHRFFGCDFSYHERSGAEMFDGDGVGFFGCRFSNNSQAIPVGSTRKGWGSDSPNTAGLRMAGGTDKNGLIVSDCVADDTQGWTAFGYYDPARPYVVTVDRSERFGIGQTLDLIGSGTAGADMKARVDDINLDEITLSNPVITFPTANLTGTYATTGTVMTGVGTAFTTELIARAYVSRGGEYRRVMKAASDTSATLDSAFTVDVSGGSTLTIVRSTMDTVASQQYGFRMSEDTISPRLGNPYPAGNVVAPTLLAGDDADLNLASGQSTMRRRDVTSQAIPSTNDTGRLTYFVASKSETISQVRTMTGTTAGVGPTLCRVGIYLKDKADGDLTLVASTPNTTSLWLATLTAYTTSLSATVDLIAGRTYAVMLLVVGTSTAPTFTGHSALVTSESIVEPRLSGFAGSVSDLPATMIAASVNGTAAASYTALIP